jgi:hypothetical protein
VYANDCCDAAVDIPTYSWSPPAIGDVRAPLIDVHEVHEKTEVWTTPRPPAAWAAGGSMVRGSERTNENANMSMTSSGLNAAFLLTCFMRFVS